MAFLNSDNLIATNNTEIDSSITDIKYMEYDEDTIKNLQIWFCTLGVIIILIFSVYTLSFVKNKIKSGLYTLILIIIIGYIVGCLLLVVYKITFCSIADFDHYLKIYLITFGVILFIGVLIFLYYSFVYVRPLFNRNGFVRVQQEP